MLETGPKPNTSRRHVCLVNKWQPATNMSPKLIAPLGLELMATGLPMATLKRFV